MHIAGNRMHPGHPGVLHQLLRNIMGRPLPLIYIGWTHRQTLSDATRAPSRYQGRILPRHQYQQYRLSQSPNALCPFPRHGLRQRVLPRAKTFNYKHHPRQSQRERARKEGRPALVGTTNVPRIGRVRRLGGCWSRRKDPIHRIKRPSLKQDLTHSRRDQPRGPVHGPR